MLLHFRSGLLLSDFCVEDCGDVELVLGGVFVGEGDLLLLLPVADFLGEAVLVAGSVVDVVEVSTGGDDGSGASLSRLTRGTSSRSSSCLF